jgi:hypothetical protein
MHPGQRGVAVLHVRHDHAQRANVEHLREVQRLAAHLLDDAVDVLGPPLHLAGCPRPCSSCSSCSAAARRSLRARPASRPAAARQLVGLGLEEAEGQVLHLPLHLPDAQPVGQRREHLQRLARHALGHRLLGGGVPAQGLQARGQPQHHHAQVARERQQHLAHVLGLRAGRPSAACEPRRGRARLPLHAHQLGGLDRQRRDSCRRRPWRSLPAACSGAGRHTPGSWRPAWPRSRPWTGWRPRRRRAPACSRRCRASRRRSAARRTRARGASIGHAGVRLFRGRDSSSTTASSPSAGSGSAALHGRRTGRGDGLDLCGATKVGAWPTPSNSTSVARGPRCVMARAVSRDSRSTARPREQQRARGDRVVQRCQSAASPCAAASVVMRNGTAMAGS